MNRVKMLQQILSRVPDFLRPLLCDGKPLPPRAELQGFAQVCHLRVTAYLSLLWMALTRSSGTFTPSFLAMLTWRQARSYIASM